MSLWHVVCGGCHVALAKGMVASQEGGLPPTTTNLFSSMSGSLADKQFGHKAKS